MNTHRTPRSLWLVLLIVGIFLNTVGIVLLPRGIGFVGLNAVGLALLLAAVLVLLRDRSSPSETH